MIQTFWTKIKDSFYVALTAVFIVLVGVLIVWFVVKVVPKIFSSFRNGIATTLDTVFVPNEDISSILDKKTISSGETFTLSFEGNSDNKLYTFNFPCTDGVSFSIVGEPKTSIECGKDFYLLNKTNEVSITGFSINKRIAVVPIKIGLQNEDSQKIDPVSNFNLTITNSNFSAPIDDTKTEEKTDSNTNYTGTSYINTYVGKADLSVKITDTGIINKNTLQFTKTSVISSTDRVGVKFEVQNIGDKISGVWNFSATLPSLTSPTYQSNSQISLKPGDKIEFTLGFDNPTTYGTNNVTINIDPSNYISEILESNNTASVSIYTNYNYYDYNNNYNYNNYNQNYGNLTASCYSIPSNPNIGENVTWYATVNGGSGTYSYYWSGTENLAGSSQSVSRIYYSGGQKNASVIITSGGYSITRGCTTNISNYNNNYGNSDLSVRLLGVGMMDSSNNFVYATQVPRYSNVAIKFEVINNGSGNSGPWDVSATLSPSMSWYTYRSNNYPSLAPGQKSEVVVNFSSAEYLGDNYFNVTIDPSNYTSDTNRSNNNLSATVRVY